MFCTYLRADNYHLVHRPASKDLEQLPCWNPRLSLRFAHFPLFLVCLEGARAQQRRCCRQRNVRSSPIFI